MQLHYHVPQTCNFLQAIIESIARVVEVVEGERRRPQSHLVVRHPRAERLGADVVGRHVRCVDRNVSLIVTNAGNPQQIISVFLEWCAAALRSLFAMLQTADFQLSASSCFPCCSKCIFRGFSFGIYCWLRPSGHTVGRSN